MLELNSSMEAAVILIGIGVLLGGIGAFLAGLGRLIVAGVQEDKAKR